jgi:murein DD-endopeptidase MepM/ murein hydrolase activator NlpD
VKLNPKILNKLFSISFVLFSAQLYAANLPQTLAVPGGVVTVTIGDAEQAKPNVFFNNNPVMVVADDNKWIAVVGVSLSAKPGKQTLVIEQGDEVYKQQFEINDKHYPTQHITIKDNSKVTPSNLDMKRINAEKAEINAALSAWSDGEVNMNFIWPLEGEVSGLFGRRRVFNGQPRRPHSGMDLAAVKGTEIHAPESGVIRNPGDYFFNGNTVFIDHGQGLVTMFCHMDRIDVVNGQVIKQGDVIGTVGMTGRATGPHLHLGVSLNNERVEPRLFFPKKDNIEPLN